MYGRVVSWQGDWEDKFATALEASQHFKRHAGADHFFVSMKYAIDITSPKLKVTPDPTLLMPLPLPLFLPLYSLLKFFAGPLIGPLPPLPPPGGASKWRMRNVTLLQGLLDDGPVVLTMDFVAGIA